MTAIELAKPRVIVIEERGVKYALKLNRISKKQWLHYFDSIVSTSEMQNSKRVDFFDSTTARVELVESALASVDGYANQGDTPIPQLAGWQQLIPLRHRQAAGNALVDIERVDPTDGEILQLGTESVFLNAVWGADDRGGMHKFFGLCHRFSTPTGEHQRRYSRDANRSMVVGGSRRGITKWMGVQATLADLYDELIQSVDGYMLNGQPLDAERDQIAAEMDTYHKVAAADALFTPASANVIDEEK